MTITIPQFWLGYVCGVISLIAVSMIYSKLKGENEDE